MQPRFVRAFSLVEVLVAVGLLATALVVVLAMLPALTKQGAEATARLQAERLPESVRLELRRLVVGNFNALAARVPVMSAPLANGLPLVATRSGARIASVDYLPPAPAENVPSIEQYFLIECWRFPDEPLRFDGTKDFLALHVRVSWPYRLPGSADGGPVTTAPADRSELTFTISLMR